MNKENIFTVGGTVQAGNGLYIPRRADDELLALCRGGHFAYVLTPRQLGKSSLMVRTAEQLTKEGARSVIIDLSQIGVQVTPEEWYLGLLSMLEEQLDLQTDVIRWWKERAHLGATQRLTRFLEEVLLKEVKAPVVVFVDEIDTTLSLNFTDDFFAAIRYFYNARSLSKDVRRLSFVLIGVATPGDLIRDPQRTPFNIGQRVDLTDFTIEEALPFAAGLGLADQESRRVLGWVLKWTGGHPYLTQRLCRALTDDGRKNWSEPDIDAVVGKTFLGRISEEDNNLQFVRDMLTKRAPDLSEVLYIYREVLNHKRAVQDEEQSLVKSHLKLSGVAQRRHGELIVRNPIYAHVFNDAWVKEHLPVNWFRRARRAGIPLAFVLLLFAAAVAGFSAVKSRSDLRSVTVQKEQAEARFKEAVRENELAKQRSAEADKKLKEAEQAKVEANFRLRDTERQAAAALATAKQQRTLAENRGRQTLQQLQLAKAAKIEAEKSAAAARAAEEQAQQLRHEAEDQSKKNALDRDIAQGQHQMSVARQLADQGEQRLLSGNGPAAELFLARALTLDDRPAIRASLLDARLKNARAVWGSPAISVEIITFSSNSSTAALERHDGLIHLIDTVSGTGIRTLPSPSEVAYLILSPDGRVLASQSLGYRINLWDVETGRPLPVSPESHDKPRLLGLTVDKLVYEAVDSTGAVIRVVDLKTQKEMRIEEGGTKGGRLSRDAKLLALAGNDGSITILDVETGEKRQTLQIGARVADLTLDDLTFSRNGRVLAARIGGESSLWDLQTGVRLLDHIPNAKSVLSNDGNAFVTVADDGFSIWETASGKWSKLSSNNLNLDQVVMGPGGKLLAAREGDGTTRILDVETGELSAALYSDGPLIDFSPDGKRLYSLDNHLLKAWDLNTWDLNTDGLGTIFSSHAGAISSVALSQDGKQLAFAGGDKTIRIWDVKTNQQVGKLTRERSIRGLINLDPKGHTVGSFELSGVSVVYSLLDTNNGNDIWSTSDLPVLVPDAASSSLHLLSPDGKTVVTQKDPGTPILIRNLENGRAFNVESMEPKGKVDYDALAFSRDSRWFAQAGTAGTVRVWDVETGKESFVLQSGAAVGAVYFSVDKKRLALVLGNRVELWDTTARRVVSNISRITGHVNEGRFSPDGRWFAGSVDNRRIKLWDVETGSLIQTLSPGAIFSSFVFSPDGKWIVSRSGDLRLWNLEAKNPETGFLLPGSDGSDMAFDRGGRYLAYGSRDGRVRVWSFEAVKHVYAADRWALFKEVKAETTRKVGGLDLDFLSQSQLRETLGDKYNPSYSLIAATEGGNSEDDERDKQAELREISLKNQPSHGASISGVVTYEGQPPQPKRIDTSADAVCGQVSPNLTTEDWIVTGGRLANAFVYVKSGSRLENYIFETPNSEVVLEKKGCRTVPRLLGLQTNQVLKLVNSDPTTSNYHITPKNNPDWNNSMPQGAQPLYHEFDRKETFIPVKDNQHPWEKSYIGVFSHPFFAITGKDGAYTISGLPPGRYTMVVWHEGGPLGTEQSVDVTISSGETKTLNFTFGTKP
jgi:WD40 repeat protein